MSDTPRIHAEAAQLPDARSLLFVPGSTPERFTKALDTDADVVCLDLEDSVAPEAKEPARRAVLRYLADCSERARLCVRINRLGSAEGLEDAAALIRSVARPAFVMVPKVESAREIELLTQAFSSGACPHLIGLIESPRGVEAAFEIAETDGLSSLLFGSFDYAAETGCSQDWSALLPVRSRIVAAAGSAAKAALDTPFSSLDDVAGAAAEAKLARQIGFSGKAAIHPKHVLAINAAFTPTEAELSEAQSILAAFTAAGGRACRVGARFIDVPVARRMERLLTRAGPRRQSRSA